MRHEIVERPILCEQLGGRLRTDLFHAWNIVHAVADQREVVDHLDGFNTEFR
jgi:hypothetical protein